MTHNNNLDASWLFIAILTLTWVAIGATRAVFCGKNETKKEQL